MKKIVNDEDKKYEYTPENKSELSNQGQTKTLDIPNKDNEKNEPTYKIVDPKKRMQMYVIIVAALVLVIVLIVINQTRTSTQTSKVVESLSYSDTYEDTTVEDETSKNTAEETSANNTSTTETIRALPTYSIKGNWKGDNSNTSIVLDGKGNFTYNWKYSKDNTIVYKGSYILRIGQGAYEACGLTIDDVSNTFHISKTDINEANLMYIDCKPTEFSANGEPFKPIQNDENEDSSPLFTHLVYLTTDNNDNVIVEYYDEITQSVCILNNTENK